MTTTAAILVSRQQGGNPSSCFPDVPGKRGRMHAPPTLELPQRNRMPVARINRHADDHGVAVSRLRLDRPIVRSRLFTCPTLTPLYHAPVFARLTPPQQRRYNQLV